MSKITLSLKPKLPSEYRLEELKDLVKKWGSIKWAANAINVSESGFRLVMKKGVTK